ncbi:O-antigen ligase family protein [Austwickia chelonae]|uniref:O-antigen ligase family protein n=1 Tax=Austwickia chelonae TaxID=100225 RepID=UPI000E286056|nr:O-antigen ligase family protein [Austwickia chelonae]
MTALTAGARKTSHVRERPPAYLWCLLLGLVTNLVSGNSQYMRLPIGPDRLLIPLAIVLLLLDGRRRHLRLRDVHLLMAALVAWTLFSMAWYDNLFNVVAVFAFADRMVLPLVLFATAPLFFDRPAHRDLLLKTLTLIGLYLGITGIIEMIDVRLAFPRYIADPTLGMMFGRARGPFLAGDAMGFSSAACGFAGAFLAYRVRRGLWRFAGLTALATGLITTVLSLTRATWVGVSLGLLLAGALVPALRKWVPLAVGGALAVVALALAVIPGLQESFDGRLNEKSSVDDRLGSNDAALALLTDLPWTGIGWRRFYPEGADWFRISDGYAMNNVVVEVHNVLLSRAVELGLPAALVFLAIWALGPGRLLVRPVHEDLQGWRILGLVVFTAWVGTGMAGPMGIPFPNYVAWLVTGVATAPWMLREQPETSDVTNAMTEENGLAETASSPKAGAPIQPGEPHPGSTT